MESYRTEEEQLEALKRWWADNGRGIVIAVVLALSASFGWQAWQRHQQQQAEGAAALYEQLLVSMSAAQDQQQGGAAAASIAEQLKTSAGNGVYAQFAALHLARMAVERDDLPAAASELRWVLERADADDDLAAVARLRLARVLAAQGDTEAALQSLGARTGQGFAAAYAAARGDILLAAGRLEAAREAYLAASLDGASGPAASTLTQKLEYLSAALEADVESDGESRAEPGQ